MLHSFAGFDHNILYSTLHKEYIEHRFCQPALVLIQSVVLVLILFPEREVVVKTG